MSSLKLVGLKNDLSLTSLCRALERVCGTIEFACLLVFAYLENAVSFSGVSFLIGESFFGLAGAFLIFSGGSSPPFLGVLTLFGVLAS